MSDGLTLNWSFKLYVLINRMNLLYFLFYFKTTWKSTLLRVLRVVSCDRYSNVKNIQKGRKKEEKTRVERGNENRIIKWNLQPCRLEQKSKEHKSYSFPPSKMGGSFEEI